jgi:hypothetical protein
MSNRLNARLSVTLLACMTAYVIAAHSQTGPRGGCRCDELRFTLAPGGSHDFVLPVEQAPVHIEITLTANNGGTQEPSEIMYAVVNQDPSSKQLTWIGTNSDGSASGSSSLKGKLIASIFGGGSGTTNASLNVANANTKTLSINQNASTTSRSCEYVVRMYF